MYKMGFEGGGLDFFETICWTAPLTKQSIGVWAVLLTKIAKHAIFNLNFDGELNPKRSGFFKPR